MYSIKLANGNTLSNLELNGNNFISATVLEDSIFEGGCVLLILDKRHPSLDQTAFLVEHFRLPPS